MLKMPRIMRWFGSYGFLRTLVGPDEITMNRIVCGDQEFILNRDITCTWEFSDDLWVIEHEPFRIIAHGATRQEALEDFGYDFAFLWDEYAQADDKDLTLDARELKESLLELVQEVNN